ncbi:BTB POZ domain [Trypanosoma vivax]|uniref:BTB domain-containing protein n=1 Tax=Trypanosoma vivax (strain Y486) TaxID=1055687 RepID=G0U3G5_TRYVY|nr:hypothetical protein TRVL_04493 [Trypanosoma vivax]KAH8613935.1 BTB POZ domain [Trypanosoma vivax]CCC50822.1 conserved hypothetical protein [Trypanosoma vivax Y486]
MPRRTTIVRERQKRKREDDNVLAALESVGTGHLGCVNAVDQFRLLAHRLQWKDQAVSSASSEVDTLKAEGAEMQEALKQHTESCQIVRRDVVPLLQQREKSMAQATFLSEMQKISPNDVARLNVGDEIFTVPLKLLLSTDESGNYFDMLFKFDSQKRRGGESHGASCFSFQPPILDETGALFIDRDPAVFRVILNYLRGYRILNTLSEEMLGMLKVDAQYFQLRGLMNDLNERVAESGGKFLPGPGVNPERNRFRVIYGVAVVGNCFLVTGRHRITFQVLNNDYVGIGLVSDTCVNTDQEFHKTPNCCVYYMTGVFYSNFPHHHKEDRLDVLEKGDYISLMVDMNNRVAQFTLKNSTKTISLGNARKLRFAVAMKMSSAVRIVPESEVKHISSFVQRPTEMSTSLADIQPSLGDERDALTQLSQTNGAVSLVSAMNNIRPLSQQDILEDPPLLQPVLSPEHTIRYGMDNLPQFGTFNQAPPDNTHNELNDEEQFLFMPAPQRNRGSL